MIFISWSGKDSRSHKTAILLRDWIPKVIQRQKCFLSSHDIEAGAQWATKLFEQLETCHVGIICLTPANLDRPWVLFEAGALAKQLDKARVCPFLIGELEESAVEFPLAAFQMKRGTKEDVFSLLEMINRASIDPVPLEAGELTEAFEARWPEFEKKFGAIIAEKDSGSQVAPQKKDAEILADIHSLVRGIATGTISVNTGNPQLLSPAFRFEQLHPTRVWSDLAGHYRDYIADRTQADRWFKALLTYQKVIPAISTLVPAANLPKKINRTGAGTELVVTVPKSGEDMVKNILPHVATINKVLTAYVNLVELQPESVELKFEIEEVLPVRPPS